jgi:hypothetical protein
MKEIAPLIGVGVGVGVVFNIPHRQRKKESYDHAHLLHEPTIYYISHPGNSSRQE